MKNIYMVQPANSISGSVYLPTSIGAIAAYSFSFKEIKDNYKLHKFIFLKEDINELLNDIEDPFIVGFSCYMWNVDYNLLLAESIKKKWPDCIIAFGGPQIPDDTSYLEKHTFIDILMYLEGETVFYSILTAYLNDGDLSSVKNISYRQNDDVIVTEKFRDYKKEIDYPSAYTNGYFDAIIKDDKYKNLQFDAVLETNRGCPYSCIYCTWGGKDNKFRKFPLERVKAELKWMAENKIAYCMCADSNFGIFDRDEYIADYVISLKKKYGFPEKFETIAAKNKDELTFKINQKLHEANLSKNISVAVQSMSPNVLKNIGRENLSTEKLSEQLKKYRLNDMYTYTDLMLGLPGESFDSFAEGMFNVIEAGQHYSFNVFRFEFLPNTRIYTKEYVEKYKIKTISSQLYPKHSIVGDNKYLGSRSNIVVETSTMPQNDWRTALRLAICTQSFHCMGLLRFVAIYLRKAKQISYYNFYMNLYKWIEKESVFIKSALDKTCISIDSFLEEKTGLFFADERFGDCYWEFEEGLFMLCAYEIENFYDEVKGYLQNYFDDEYLFNELFSYQKEIINYPLKSSIQIEYKYNWCEYFDNLFNEGYVYPKTEKTIVTIGACTVDNWKRYAKEIVWYGRRDDKTVNKNIRYTKGDA